MNSTIMWIVVGVAVLAIVAAIIYAVTRNNNDSRGVSTQGRGTGEGIGTRRRTPTTPTTTTPPTTRADVDAHPRGSTDDLEQPREDDVRRESSADDGPEQRRRGRRGGNSRP
ncbi:MAG: hypothetical protein WKF73_06355 [Nocardioidaceae bacterium]